MAKKIRFSLEMKDGVQVRTLEELQEYFSLEKVLVYIEDGKLDTWLRDRYQNDIADGIAALDKSDSDYNRKLCALFDVEYDEAAEEEMAKAAERAEKLKKLRAYTDEPKYLDNVDDVAFEQDDLFDLLDEGATTIYLCGEKFSIPLGKSGISYIGVNNPTVVINSKSVVDWSAKGITLNGVKYDEKYQAIADAEEMKKTKAARQLISYGDYKKSYLASQFTREDEKSVKQTYDMVAHQLGELHNPDCQKLNFSLLTKDIGKKLVDGIDLVNASDTFKSNKSEYTFRADDELSLIFDYKKINSFAKDIMDNAVVFAATISSFLMIKQEGYKYFHYSDEERAKRIANSYRPYHEHGFHLNAGYMAIFWALMILTVDESQKDKLSMICDFSHMMGISGEEICDIIAVIEIIYYEEGAIESQSEGTISSEYIIETFVQVLVKYGYVKIVE